MVSRTLKDGIKVPDILWTFVEDYMKSVNSMKRLSGEPVGADPEVSDLTISEFNAEFKKGAAYYGFLLDSMVRTSYWKVK